jgi:hypothetical protein
LAPQAASAYHQRQLRGETAMGLAYGVMAGVVIGVLTGQLAICVALGTSFGVLAQGFLDAKKSNKP